MKILGEANNQALFRDNLINEVLLRIDGGIFFIPPGKNFSVKFFILSILQFNSVLNLTTNNYELIKITSQ